MKDERKRDKDIITLTTGQDLGITFISQMLKGKWLKTVKKKSGATVIS